MCKAKREWIRTHYNEIKWVEDKDEDGEENSTGYGVIANLEGENGLTYQCRLYPSPGMGNDWLAWSILLNGTPIYTSKPDFGSVAEAIEDCHFHCGMDNVEPYHTEIKDGWK